MKLQKKSDCRVWPCLECPKIFGRKGDLTRHERLHQGYKPHRCSQPGCGKEFSQFSGLKTHTNVHTREKPYVCNFGGCGAAFGDPSSCARHRKETHRRIGGYRCPFPRCNSRIKRRSAFAAHLKRHRIDPISLDIDSLAPPLLPAALPVSHCQSIRQVAAYDVKPVDAVPDFNDKEILYPHRIHGAGSHQSDMALYGNPYSKHSGSCNSPYYPADLAPGISQLNPLRSDFDYNLSKFEEFERLYILDLSSPQHAPQGIDINMRHPPLDINMHPSTLSSAETCLAAELQTVNLTHRALTSDHFLSPSRKQDYVPQRKAIEYPCFFPLPEAAWVFS